MTPEEAEAKFGTQEALIHNSYKKGAVAIHYQHESVITDLFEICRFVSAFSKIFSNQDLYSLYRLATGIEMDEKTIQTVAERVYTIERAFLVRMGISRKDDVLEGKWATGPIPHGPYKGEELDPVKWEGMLDEYYQLRGWDRNGAPTPEKLKQLGLDDIIEKMK
jgi:aldehyde:ferredoxin oxidoreductase